MQSFDLETVYFLRAFHFTFKLTQLHDLENLPGE
jgi:hypothetical protein